MKRDPAREWTAEEFEDWSAVTDRFDAVSEEPHGHCEHWDHSREGQPPLGKSQLPQLISHVSRRIPAESGSGKC